MEKREKTEFILEQIRLVLEKKDYVRAQILANKVGKKVLNEEGFEVRTPFLLYYFFTCMRQYGTLSCSFPSFCFVCICLCRCDYVSFSSLSSFTFLTSFSRCV